MSAFTDKIVIVTGASAGIGRAMARQLSASGSSVVLAARNVDRLADVAAECSEEAGTALPVPTDVSDPDQCKALVERAVEAFGRIDMLVNNAGISMVARFDEVETIDIFDRLIRTNYLGSVYTTFYALKHLKDTRGRLVAVSSLAGKTGVPTRTGYAASKYAMAGFFDSLRIELANTGVSVTTVYPGIVTTEIRARAFGPDGEPTGNKRNRSNAMTAEQCATAIIEAAAKRKRELVMTAKGRTGQWLKLAAPGLVDRIARRTIERDD